MNRLGSMISQEDKDILRKAYCSSSGMPTEVLSLATQSGLSRSGSQIFQEHCMMLGGNAAMLRREELDRLIALRIEATSTLTQIAREQDFNVRRGLYENRALPVLRQLDPDRCWDSADDLTAGDIDLYLAALRHMEALLVYAESADQGWVT